MAISGTEVFCSTTSITPISATGEDLETGAPAAPDSFYCQTSECREPFAAGGCLPLPATVQLKQALKAAVVAPWVRVAFIRVLPSGAEEEETIISVGNRSMEFEDGTCPNDPEVIGDCLESFLSCENCCSASVRAFQYGWGSIQSGSACRVTIVDDRGGEFNQWAERIFQDPTQDTHPNFGRYKMKVNWGWIVAGEDACDGVRRILTSPTCWFLPMGVTVNLQNGKFVYEIEGADPMQRGQENALPFIEGTATEVKTFKQAVCELAKQSLPRFNVAFLARRPTDTDPYPEEMRFFVPPGCSGTVSATEGPRLVWRCNQEPPLTVIQRWLQVVQAEGPDGMPRGITMNYDATFDDKEPSTDDAKPTKGRLILWTNDMPTCSDSPEQFDQRIRAAYVVHGGNCSPVLSFTPSFKYQFQAASRAGGLMGTTTGRTALMENPGCDVEGRGSRVSPAAIPGQELGGCAMDNAIQAAVAHRQANLRHFSIEAELRVQGDPSAFLCTPLLGYMRTIALIVINPYFLHIDSLTPGGSDDVYCYQWVTRTVTGSACNETMTNKAWFIKGVDHQIKEGSYVTSYKLILFPTTGTGPAPVGFHLLPLEEKNHENREAFYKRQDFTISCAT